MRLIEETKCEIQLPEESLRNIEFRTATIVLPRYLGSGRCYKAYAVLPDYVNVTSVSALRSNTLNDYLDNLYKWKVKDPEMWLSPVAKLLIDSFVLSDQAKKFLIARQAFMADNGEIHVFSPLFLITTYLFYFVNDALYKSMKRTRFHGTYLGAFGVVVLSFAVTYTNFFLFRYIYVNQLSKDADAKAITRGRYDSKEFEEARKRGEKLPVDPHYYEGAMEFYSKEIQRNRALRLLTKKTAGWFKDSSRQFSDEGDYRSSIFAVGPFPSQRIRDIVSWKLGSERIGDRK